MPSSTEGLTASSAVIFLPPQDVDQRLTRDVERLCNDLAALIPSAVKPVVDLLWFRYCHVVWGLLRQSSHRLRLLHPHSASMYTLLVNRYGATL